jgi:ABC-type thiamin/hydroxymethylpyrimidine transport system permease subunit
VSFIPIGAPVAGQFLVGLHNLWLVLVAVIVMGLGAATVTGALKGAIEMLLHNHLGPFIFLTSFLEKIHC